MLQGAQKTLGLLEYNVQCEASVCRLLMVRAMGKISNMGKTMGPPSRLRCAWSRAGSNCLVGNARCCPAGETDLDGLMAKQSGRRA